MMPAPQTERVMTFEDARGCVEQHASKITPPDSEEVALLDSPGRVLAQPVVADRDLPPFERATRDGFAVRFADVSSATTLRLAGQIKAGDPARTQPLAAGECVEIMTGAPVPPGADAVVMVEHTIADGNSIRFAGTATAGQNIVPRGSEAIAGRTLVEVGTRISHAQIAVAAAVGCAKMRVFRKPRIAILSTGDEVIEIA